MEEKLKLVIKGAVNGQEITKWVKNYRPDIPEKRETALRNFWERVELMGGNA